MWPNIPNTVCHQHCILKVMPLSLNVESTFVQFISQILSYTFHYC